MERHNGLEQDPEGAFVYHDDAQATIAALQAQVKELEAGKSRMILDAIEIGGQFSDLREAVRALKEALQFVMLKAPGYDWNTDPLSITLMVGNALTKSDHVLAGEPDEENDSLQSQLTQRTVELHETQNHLADADNEVEQLRKQLSERTAELEAVQRERDEWRRSAEASDDANDIIVRDLQAELERVRGELAEERASVDALREQNRVLRQLVQDVVNSGVAFEDGRIPYKEVQIDRTWFDDAKAALTATSQEGQHE